MKIMDKKTLVNRVLIKEKRKECVCIYVNTFCGISTFYIWEVKTLFDPRFIMTEPLTQRIAEKYAFEVINDEEADYFYAAYTLTDQYIDPAKFFINNENTNIKI